MHVENIFSFYFFVFFTVSLLVWIGAVFYLPLTQCKHPGRTEPEEEDEEQQRAPWVFVHQYLEDKAEGEVDVVEWADGPVGGAQQHFAVQQDGPAHQVQAEEHEHGQDQLHVHQYAALVAGKTQRHQRRGVGVTAHLPVCANRLDDTDRQLQSDQKNPPPGQGNAPVHLVIVDDEKLKNRGEQERQCERGKTNTVGGITVFILNIMLILLFLVFCL